MPGPTRKSLVAAIAATVTFALAAGGSAPAATTAYDASGRFLVDGRPTFLIALLHPPPLGTVTPWGTDALAEVSRAGVNIVASGPHGRPWQEPDVRDAQGWAAAAAAHGVHTWVNLRELARAQAGSPEETKLREVVTTLANEPGLALWKGPDEPWWSKWPASSLRYAYDVTKSLDPSHLWMVIEAPRGTAVDLAPYSAVTDGHGVDVYPVRWGASNPDLHEVGRWTRTMVAVTPNRAVFTTLQICFSGSDDPSGSGAYVMPTATQERYMAYDAILNGARGLVFFGGDIRHCLNETDTAHGWNWEFWNGTLRNLVAEIGPRSRLYPALVGPPARARIRTSDATTQVLGRRAGSRELWVIAARSGVGTKRVTIRGLPRSLTRGTVYREGRTVRVRNGAFTDRFSRWDVNVYRFRR